MPANASAKNPPEERLVNLVVALMATEQGLTKDTILTLGRRGTASSAEAGASKDALEKMFERDKESLRGLGVPIETIGDWADPDDLREARYRVPTAEYELPEDIVFTPAELALLNLAGGVWSESSMSADARSGLRKIRALGIDVDEPIIGYSPRISLREPSFAALQQAIEQSRVVTFPYLKPGEAAPRIRRVQPLALVEYEGALARLRRRPRRRRRAHLPAARASSATSPSPARRFDAALREGAGERALAGLEDVAARNHGAARGQPGHRGRAAAQPARDARRSGHPRAVRRRPRVRGRAGLVRSGGARRRARRAARPGHRAPATPPRACTRRSRMIARKPLVATDRAALMLQLVPVPDRQGRGLDRRGRRRVRRDARSDARDGRDAHRDRAARRRRLLADGERPLRHRLGSARRARHHRHHELGRPRARAEADRARGRGAAGRPAARPDDPRRRRHRAVRRACSPSSLAEPPAPRPT